MLCAAGAARSARTSNVQIAAPPPRVAAFCDAAAVALILSINPESSLSLTRAASYELRHLLRVTRDSSATGSRSPLDSSRER